MAKPKNIHLHIVIYLKGMLNSLNDIVQGP